MHEPIAEREAIWTEFLERWPLESLPTMTLKQYSQAGTDDYFCRWLEKHTESLGSIWGGSSFKFGVFSRLDKEDKHSPHHSFSPDYAWLNKYGDSAQEAFAHVRGLIVAVANAARKGDLDVIENADLGPVFKWKIAFLYQDRERPQILGIFAARDLRAALGERASYKENLAGLHRQMIANRSDENLFAYSDRRWDEAQRWLHEQSLPEQALGFFNSQPDRFEAINTTQKMAGFIVGNGRQLALVREKKELSAFVSPGPWQQLISTSSTEHYPSERTRHSGLGTCAPLLTQGAEALLVTFKTLRDLDAFCEAYELDDAAAEPRLPSIEEPNITMSVPLNQILFGPPGTGKTHATIDAALEILDPDFLRGAVGERTLLKARFDELIHEDRVRFVTFHQSFSYEDFVEGIRALPSEGDDQTGGVIRYDVEPGIFRKLCEDAVRDKAYEHKVGVREHARVWKISIDDAGPSETRNYCFEHGEARIGWQYVGDIRNANLADPALKLGTNEQSSLNMFGNEILPGDILLCLRSKTSICGVGVVTGEYRFDEHQEAHLREDFVHVLPVRWLAKHINFDILTLNGDTSLTQKTVYPLSRIKWPALQQALQDADIALEAAHSTAKAATAHQPHVLIIDEINRGNISRIFGELITLLEPSKRAGAEEALHVQLPYSKAQFSVPSNVYLIGTMNTADRSLAGLDIALRRRFSFKEMPPQPELLREITVNEINIADLLSTMNERIEVLLDRDHCLGHAYFMPLEKERTMERLAMIFRNQVLPLLQEYFFEDWQRIQWVLNDHRKPNPADRFVFQTKADLGVLFGDNVPVPSQNMPWRINQQAFTRASAYRGLIAAMQQTAVPASELETVTP